MADQPVFTSAQRAASLHRRLCDMAVQFDDALTELVRDPLIGAVSDELILRDKQAGGGIRLRIEAEAVDEATVAAAEARVRSAAR